MTNGFDRLAKPYRWMEYLTFGRSLERCRFLLLPRLTKVRSALLLGDGDGRFAAQLLREAPNVLITAVDSSPGMLQALQVRCARPAQVETLCMDLGKHAIALQTACRFDLVATHFFLDCFCTTQVEDIVLQTKLLLVPGARWIVSEFAIPPGWMSVPSTLVVWFLYIAFYWMTGLRVRQLPDYRRAHRENGFTCITRVPLLRGLLVSEEWEFTQNQSCAE